MAVGSSPVLVLIFWYYGILVLEESHALNETR